MRLFCKAWAALLIASLPSIAESPRPNVIVVLTDDQGYGDFGVHGNRKIRTPHLDRFARDGVRMTRFYSSPVCAPTRASLMTGRYYYRSGVIHTSRGAAKMAGDNVTLAEILREGGYTTGCFGKWHLGDNYPMRPQDQGFDEVLVHKSGGIGQSPDKGNRYQDPILYRNGERIQAKGYCTDVFMDGALRFITRNRDRPFFAYVATNTPHTPLQVDARYSQPYADLGMDESLAKIYGMITNIDDNFGRLVAALDTLKLREKTLVVFFGDNGPNSERYNAGLRDRKASVYEGGIRSPCFIQWPRKIAGNRTNDSLSAHIDLAPTILDACGVRTPAGVAFDGVSFWDSLLGTSTPRARRKVFFQCHRGLTPKRYQHCAVVTRRFKLVGYPGTFQNEDLSPSPVAPNLELYDLTTDPGEIKNVAAAHPEVVARLRAAYDTWFDDVRASRNFAAGRIHIGADEENPLRLCWYQDAAWLNGVARGWPVVVVQAAGYEITVEAEYVPETGDLHVTWDGEEIVPQGQPARPKAVVKLPAGEGLLNVWFDDATDPANRRTVGNVRIRKL